MDFLPISINIKNKKIVIIGGGNVATQKVFGLYNFTKNITVVAPQISDVIKNIGVEIIEAEYTKSHINDAFLVYACTNNSLVNKQVADDAEVKGILFNRTDDATESSFISPAIVQNSTHVVAVNSKNKNVKSTVDLRNKLNAFLTDLDVNQVENQINKGKVYLVGFGPGNPDLLTIKGDKLCQQADVIFYDDLLDSTALDKYNGEKVYVGKRRGNHHKCQDEINEILYQAAKQEKMVVRLKGGDPLIFGRGSEEKVFLEERSIDVTIIPGITSAIAAAAYGGIPLTHRGISSTVAFGTAHGKTSFKILEADTSVYYMGAKNVIDIAQKYLDSGYVANYPVGIVYNASMPDQEVIKTTIGELITGKFDIKSPIISIFGNTVNFQEIINQHKSECCNNW